MCPGWAPEARVAVVTAVLRSVTFIVSGLMTVGAWPGSGCAMTDRLCPWGTRVERQLQFSGTFAFKPLSLAEGLKQPQSVTSTWGAGTGPSQAVSCRGKSW